MKSSRNVVLVLAAALAAVVYFAGVRPRLRAQTSLEARSEQTPIVNVIIARKDTSSSPLSLPATLEANQDTAVFARTTGYLAKWLVDIGDPVKEGQTMATIDTPDLDQEYNQALANLQVAQANLNLAKISAQRWKDLGKQNAVAQQDVDQKEADYAARNADVVAAQANLDRLKQLKAYQNVTAPYDGVVTARNAQVGALVNPGGGTELFHVVQNDPLRVYVNVPQSYVRSLKAGLPAEVQVAEFPGRSFPGKIARISGAIDAASRTLLTEVDIPNPRGELYAGMFGNVRFKLAPGAPAILLPANAAIVRAEGTLVAEVVDGKVKLQKVRFGRDFGTQIEILDGLAEGTQVILNPSDALADGEPVTAVIQEPKAAR